NNQPKQFGDSAYWMQNKNFILNSRQDLSQIKLVFEKKLGGLSAIRFGSEYWYAYNPAVYNDTLHKLIDNYTSIFAETDIYLTNDIAAKVGARFEHSSLINKSDIAPRVSLAY